VPAFLIDAALPTEGAIAHILVSKSKGTVAADAAA
jgi:hypothetical protein